MEAEHKMAQKIQFRRDTSANWASVNPILSQGELGFETNTGKFKIGNGSSYWSEIGYHQSGGGDFSTVTGTIGETQIPQGVNAVVIPTHLRSANNGEAGQVLSLDSIGQFEWITLDGGSGAPLATVATTGNYDDLAHLPTFSLGNVRDTNTIVGIGSLSEGSQYKIVTQGGSDWTLAGSSSNNVGTVFTALNNGNVAGGTGTVRLVGRFSVALTGNYLDLLEVPTTLSSFTDDVGYISTVTLSTYVTTSQVDQIVGATIDAAIGSSGTFYQVLQELASANTSTFVADALAARLRVDVDTQGLTTQEKSNAVTNLGLATVAVSGSFNDLADVPETFAITPASYSEIGGVIIGSGLTVDNVGRINVDTSTVTVSIIGEDYQGPLGPYNLKGEVGQSAGQLLADSNFVYIAKSTFNPSPYTTNATASSSTNVITSAASQWLAQIDNAKAGYASGSWRLYNPAKDTSYSITGIATSGGVAYVTLDSQITYNISQSYYIQTTDTWARIAQMDAYGTQPASIGGLESTSASGTITLASGQPYGTTATMFTLDCTGITYGELAVSFTDTNNTEYYKGTLEVHLYPDSTYIIQPNTAGNKTDRIGVGFTSGASEPYTNPALIKIPVYNTDFNQATILTQSTCVITNIKYSWLIRSNI